MAIVLRREGLAVNYKRESVKSDDLSIRAELADFFAGASDP